MNKNLAEKGVGLKMNVEEIDEEDFDWGTRTHFLDLFVIFVI